MITSAEEFYQLRVSKLSNEYLRAAHDEAPIEVWREIIATRPDMRSWVAHNKTVPLEILEILAGDMDADVRCTVAGKRKISEKIALQLANDPDENVRAFLARNRKLPEKALKILQSDQSTLIQGILYSKKEKLTNASSQRAARAADA